MAGLPGQGHLHSNIGGSHVASQIRCPHQVARPDDVAEPLPTRVSTSRPYSRREWRASSCNITHGKSYGDRTKPEATVLAKQAKKFNAGAAVAEHGQSKEALRRPPGPMTIARRAEQTKTVLVLRFGNRLRGTDALREVGSWPNAEASTLPVETFPYIRFRISRSVPQN